MEELNKGNIELLMLDSKLKLGNIHVTNDGELFIGAVETTGDKQSGYETNPVLNKFQVKSKVLNLL